MASPLRPIRTKLPAYDVVVVGSGPNGLAAAITVARAGRSVVLVEANETIGGACRSAELTEPGFIHDIGAAIQPLAVASPFLSTIDWEGHGLSWVRSPAAVAHPLDDGSAAVAWNDLNRTAAELGADAKTYRSMYGPLVERFDELVRFSMQPLVRAARTPLTTLRVGPQLAAPATLMARRFDTDRARALFAGHAAHAVVPLSRPFTAGFGFLLGAVAHAVGWPFPAGGAGEITRVLAEVLEELGGEIVTGSPINTARDLPDADAVVFALSPHQIAAIGGEEFSPRQRRRLRRFTYGPGACKVDLALSEPVPWTNPDVGLAATVHLGGTLEEVVEAESAVGAGGHPGRPFVLLAQHTPFDPSRAPDGKHTIWAYCHVPNGSSIDMSDAIIGQIERFAPGFRDTILATSVSMPADLERGNANLIGGDIGGGSYANLQAIFRPGIRVNPYRTAVDRFFIGSASANPGGGVHGMSGHQAALTALDFLDRTS
ncbi:MAG: NAD(P)/FAD-dependent oxidoreductase [Actinomycetota bacterium]